MEGLATDSVIQREVTSDLQKAEYTWFEPEPVVWTVNLKHMEISRAEFTELFEEALTEAISLAEETVGARTNDQVVFLVYGAGFDGELMLKDAAVEAIFINNESFYRVIDIGVFDTDPEQTTIWLRVSGHAPGPFSESWDPNHLGPFKTVIGERIMEKATTPGK